MIDQHELPAVIGKSLPELSLVLEKEKCDDPYDIVRHMLQYTISQVVSKNIKTAKKCLSLAEKLYKRGNSVIKNAIENVYVYSFSHAFFYDESQRKELLQIVPLTLYQLYKKQVVNSHL